MTNSQHPLVVDYLVRLGVETRRLPQDQARELLADIEEHLSAGLAEDASEADVRNTLDRLGTPAEVVDAAMPPSADVYATASPTKDRRWVEVGALVGLLAAEVLFVILPVSIVAWIVGLVLLAMSNVWSAREKLIGYLALGTGFVAAWLIIGVSLVASPSESCSISTTSEAGVETSVCTGGDGGLTVVNYLAIGLTIAYFAFQIYALWVLIRAIRKHRAEQPVG